MEPTERIELPTPRFMEHPVCYAQTFQDYKARVLLIKLWVHMVGGEGVEPSSRSVRA